MAEFLPALRLDLAQPAPPLASLFPTPVSEVWLEIGFGGGEHLLRQAERHPSIGLIGCEPYLNGVASLLGEIDRDGPATIRLHDGDARELITWLPEWALARTFILFPDPWPKKRQRKRRLISSAMLSDLARTMQPGAELRFASDDADYVEVTRAAAEETGDFTLVTETERRPDDWPETRYERKAVQAGRAARYLIFSRRSSPERPPGK